MRIAVALSGGVDSAVAAVLLKKHNPGATIGAFYMRNWDPQLEDDSGCKSDIDWESAKKTAEILKIPVKRLSFVRQYWSSVFEPTLKTYVSGGTPNPDILCNREIKFGSLYASLLTGDPENKYDLLATGHYCRIREHKSRLWITQATDLLKDQSYFLSMVPNNIIKNVKFPLGTLSKTFVRQIAKDSGLTHVLQRPESMGLCFVGKRTKKFASFLDDYCTIPIFRVISWDHDYREIGTAPGSLTVGQNVRIAGLSSKMYVIIKDVAKRTLIVSASK